MRASHQPRLRPSRRGQGEPTDALDVVRVCFRRWYLVLPFVLAAVGAGYLIVRSQQPAYHAQASFTFAHPYSDTDPGTGDSRAGNPLGETDLLGAALKLSFASPDWQEQLGDPAAVGAPFGQPNDGRRFALDGAGYSYTVESWAREPAPATTTVQNVLEAAQEESERLQESVGAPADTRYTVFVLSPTRVETIPPPSGVQLVVSVGLVGAILGAVLALWLDSWAAGRERDGGRTSRSTAAPETPPAELRRSGPAIGPRS